MAEDEAYEVMRGVGAVMRGLEEGIAPADITILLTWPTGVETSS